MAASNSGEQSAAERPLLGRAVSRRAVLLAGGGALLLAGVRSSALSLAAVTAADAPTARLHLVRPQDMLVLDFDFYNLAPVSDVDPPVLRRVDPTKRCVVVAHFSSQHVMEENVHEGATLPEPGTLAARAVGPSRIAFLIPETVKELPYREDGLLQWWQWVMQVVTAPGEPGPLQTDLLLVDWLHLTPDAVATWAHATAPVEHNGRTELWHTRLSLRGANGRPQESIAVSKPEPKTVPTVRAVYTPEDPQHTDLFDALDAADRPDGKPSVVKQIVQLSSNPSVDVHAPVRADLVALSATGATVDLLGKWKPSGQALDVAGWEHHAWQGRDNKVVVEVYGFLFPFGHRALEVTETKREFDPDSGVAYLRQRKVIRVLEPVKSYPADNHPADGRAFPFTEVTIRTLVLPNMPDTTVPLAGHPSAYWIQDVTSPRPGGGFSDVVFALTATDLTGRRIEFTTPLGFIPKSNGETPTDGQLTAIRDKFATYADILTTPPDPRRVLDLGGQEVAYAPEKKPGTTSLPTDRWYWGVELAAADPPPEPDPDTGVKPVAFFPKLLAAQARVPALDAMIGPGEPVFLRHDDSYVAGGLGANRALAAAGSDPEIFVRVQESLEGISTLGTDGREDQPLVRRMESTAQAGGIAAPHLAVGALSANLGQVSGSQESINKVRDTGTLVFKDYFPDLGGGLKPPALLGDILLSELFKDGDVTTGGPQLLKVLEYPKDAAGNPDRSKPPIGQTMTLYWQNNPVDVGPLEVRKDGNGVSQFRLECVSHVNFADPTRPTVTVSGRLTDFSLVFVKPGTRYIEVEFKRLSFRTEGSGKPKFDVDIGEVTFGGPFQFVNVLRDLISGVFGGSGGPASRTRAGALAAGNTPAGRPEIDVTPQGVTAAVRLGIPALPLGAFSISGLKFGAGVILPFTGGPVRARFAFSEPSDKFLVTAYGLGGGGHFIIEVSTRGVEMIEASIELAGNVALDLVVASGRLTIAAGIAFRLETGEPDTVTLTGYLRAMGRLSVLGLITICAEFYLALEYKQQGDQSTVTGRGFVTVSIDILFFHKSVSIAFEKTFVGSGGGTNLRALAADSSAPTFGDIMSRDDWEAYCASFAG